MFADDLRKSILQAAIQGKLSEQLPTDGNARQLLSEIQAEKSRLIKEKKIKPAPPLPPIAADEIPFDIPQNWCWARLGDIIDLLSGRDLNLQDYNSNGNGIPYITGASNFSGEEILINRWTEKPACIAYGGDLLITCKGSVGTMAVMKIEKAHIARQIMCVHKSKFFSIHYLKIFLQSKLNYLQKNKKGIIPGIERKTILEILIPLPPLAEQKRIVEKVSALLTEIAALADDEKELLQLEKEFPRKMKASLLQAAIQGKLSKQLPTDGDARALLRDIQAEKLRLIKEKKIKPAPPLPPISPDEIPFEIPANWCWARLGDIGIFVSGYTPKNDELCNAGKIPYFKVSDMNSAGNEIWLHNTKLYLKDELNKKVYEKNLIVYPKNGGAIFTNKRRILKQDSVVDLNTGGFKIIGNLDLMYVFNYFLTIDFRFLYKGTALPTVDNKKLFERLIPLPPLAEQKRIVARLEELLKEIEF